MKKKTSLVTLGKELGVSAATVSRALNNSHELNADTVARIRKKAAEYGFSTRKMTPRTINICALIQHEKPDEGCFFPYTAEVMRGIMEYLHPRNLDFSLFCDTAAKLNNGLLLRKLSQRNINGVVLINTTKHSTFYDELNQCNFPYYSLFTGPEKINKHLLTVDNVKVAFQSIEYLTQLGHRQIGAIIIAPKERPGRDRLRGYKHALKQAGITFDPALVCKTEPYGFRAGYEETLALFRSHPEITALFVTGEQIAVGALHAFQQLGILIPKHVSLITCDDAPDIEYLNPPLTVMRLPIRKLGHTAAQRVHQMINGENPNPPTHEPWMEGELIIRESTAPPTSP